MKSYQDADPLHGHGKAIPKPKQPNPKPLFSNYVGRPIQPGQLGRCCRYGCRSSR